MNEWRERKKNTGQIEKYIKKCIKFKHIQMTWQKKKKKENAHVQSILLIELQLYTCELIVVVTLYYFFYFSLSHSRPVCHVYPLPSVSIFRFSFFLSLFTCSDKEWRLFIWANFHKIDYLNNNCLMILWMKIVTSELFILWFKCVCARFFSSLVAIQ